MNNENNEIKISLVEDCLLTRISLKHSLSLIKNLKIVSDFDNAEDCINSLKKHPVNVILMDLDLFGMNGIEATSLIKKNFPDIKVVILTLFNTKDIFTASMFSGANGFVVKNIPVEKLVQIIRSVYFGAYWFDPLFLSAHKEVFPKPDSFDLRHLYNKKKSSYDLTVRELEVLKLVVEGKSNTEIAKEMIVSTNTAKAHVGNILNKMHVTDRVQAAVKAVKANII